MTNQLKTRQIQPDRTIDSLFPTRFLKPTQLIAWKVTSVLVTISRMIEEEVQPKPGQMEWKTVIYFMAKNGTEYPQGYLLSAKVDAEALITATSSEKVSDLPGKQIKINLAEYRGKAVLRIDPAPIAPPPVETPTAEAEPPEPEVITDSPQGEEYGF